MLSVCSRSVRPDDAMHEVSCPFFAAVRGYACDQNTHRTALAIEAARFRMARALQPTIDRFIKHHYAAQHWAFDRELTASDIEIRMDENLYAFGVFYNDCTFRMFVTFPALSRDGRGRYSWTMQNVEMTAFDFVQPLTIGQRLLILSFMLTVEQHVHVLKSIPWLWEP